MAKPSAWCADMANLLKSLRSDSKGSVAVEFALWVMLFFITALGAFDLGEMIFNRAQMGSAVSAASLQAFDQRDDVKFNELTSYVRALANDDALAVTISCNGVANSCTNLNRTCACLSHEGTFVTRQCGAPCSGSNMTSGVNAGYYLTITASQPFSPALLPKEGVESNLSQTATVRLQ
ncbi:TadE/TadG family type IV pilus assembly protein [Blastomonas aquatica]|uniref:TadE/TadG family type IV pilus assembly protein n=1 Tax=Blastomonas aquatica TaxID=1510276 RepID=UPI001664C70A|nr:TadE family protein [Blastomonas aquatica]